MSCCGSFDMCLLVFCLYMTFVCIFFSSSTPSCVSNVFECQKFYPTTFYPNNLTANLPEATSIIRIYKTLADLQCSELSELLVCLALSPECTDSGYRMPCVDLCNAVKRACEDDLLRTSLIHSDSGCILNCDR